MGNRALELKNQINNLIDLTQALIDQQAALPESDPRRKKIGDEISRLRAWTSRWEAEYKKLTGKHLYPPPDMSLYYAELARKQGAEKQALDNLKRTVGDYASGLENRLQLLEDNTRSAQRRLVDSTFLAFLIQGAGGGSTTTLARNAVVVIPRARKALERAKELLRKGDPIAAAVHLGEVARWIESGNEALGHYDAADTRGAAAVESAIKAAVSVSTGGLASGAGILTSIGVEAGTAATMEVTILAAKAVKGEKISMAEVDEALLNTASAGASAGVGGVLGEVLAPGLAKLLNKQRPPSQAQIEAVRDALTEHFTAHSKQGIELLKQGMAGKPLSVDVLAAILAPALSRIPVASKIVEESTLRENLVDLVLPRSAPSR